jgi:dUTP pyrophosphatase
MGKLNHAPVHILIDSGAMGNFISSQTADRFSFSLHDVPNIPITFANGAVGSCNKAVQAAYLCFENHEENIDLRVVSLPHHDIILGKTWLEKWNPQINWQTHEITINTIDQLPIKHLEPNARLPERKTPQAAGYDLTPSETVHLAPGEQQLINTGIAIAIPEGYYGQLSPRSSLAKKGITVEGGVIDSDYRGPIKIILRNQGSDIFTFTPGENPIAQIVLIKIITPEVQEVQELQETSRTGGFGSTNQITFISNMEVDQAIQEEEEVFLCEVTLEGDIIVNAQDPRIQPLLQEFADVFPQELPPELPPKHDIDHHIDLEPGN